jgi:hypothetical protein
MAISILSQVQQGLVTAHAMTESRVAELPNYGVYVHAREQIAFMKSILDKNLIPTDQEKSQIDIGFMATRELEVDEPEYAAALIYLAARFSEL